MKKGEKHGIIALVVIAIVGFGFLMQLGYLTQYGFPPLSQVGNNNNNNNNNGGNTATDYSKGIGKFSLDFKCAKTFDSSALVVDTDVDVWVLHYVNGQYSPEGAAYDHSKTQYFTATASDNGIMWIEVKPKNLYYIDYNTIMSKEGGVGYVTGVQYISDPLADGHKDFIFQFNLKNQPVPAAGMYPVLSFTVWVMLADPTFPGFNAQPTNMSEIELVSVPKFQEWDHTFTAAGDAIALYKVEMKFGNGSQSVTDQTKVRLTSLSIPGLGTIDGTSFQQTFTTVDIRYTYDIATSLYGADYIMLPANANNKYPWNAQFQFTLASGDQIPCILTVYYLDTTGAGHSFTMGLFANEGAAATGIP